MIHFYIKLYKFENCCSSSSTKKEREIFNQNIMYIQIEKAIVSNENEKIQDQNGTIIIKKGKYFSVL